MSTEKATESPLLSVSATENSTARTTDADSTKVVINACFGGFGLSDAAYEKLIEWGVPVQKYQEEPRNADTHLYQKVEANEGEVIFDRELTLPGENSINDLYHQYKPNSVTGRYWETWASDNREHPLIIRVVEELGERANGSCAKLRIVEIPATVEYVVEEYDGREHIAEAHQTWS